MSARRATLGAFLCAALAACAGCAAVRPARALVIEATGEALIEPARPGAYLPSARWDRTARASGTGLPAPEAATDEMKRLTALEAARLTALARLVEQVEGVRVAQSARVRDMAFGGQQVETAASGHVSGAQMVEADYDPASGLAMVTVLVGLNEDGEPVPAAQLPVTPLSLPARRVRAEAAARIDALAALRERLGELKVAPHVRVRGLARSYEPSRPVIEGILDGARLGGIVWVSAERCRVEARLRVPPGDMERLREMAERVGADSP